MKTLNITLKNETGLHARPASQLVDCVKQFESEIMIKKEGDTYNASSMISVLSMEADKGSELVFTIDGTDETSAFDALKQLFEHELE